jgi:hypothetical protein
MNTKQTSFSKKLKDFESYDCSSFIAVAAELLKKYPQGAMGDMLNNENDFMRFAEKIRDAADLMSKAWDGGDEVMKPIMFRILKDMRSAMYRHPSKQENLFDGMSHLLGEDLMEYVEKLQRFDWAYSYSDDIKVYRCGKDTHEQLRTVAEDKGGLYQKAYDYYSNWMKK